jgi:hypothetical protein
MRIAFSALAISTLLIAPAQAQSINSSLDKFCSAIRSINSQGVSAAPGTPTSRIIISGGQQTTADYRMVWQFAKSSNTSTCRGIW